MACLKLLKELCLIPCPWLPMHSIAINQNHNETSITIKIIASLKVVIPFWVGDSDWPQRTLHFRVKMNRISYTVHLEMRQCHPNHCISSSQASHGQALSYFFLPENLPHSKLDGKMLNLAIVKNTSFSGIGQAITNYILHPGIEENRFYPRI